MEKTRVYLLQFYVPVGKIALFSRRQVIVGCGYPLAEQCIWTESPSEASSDWVELSEMTGGRRTDSTTSALMLFVTDNTTWQEQRPASVSWMSLICKVYVDDAWSKRIENRESLMTSELLLDRNTGSDRYLFVVLIQLTGNSDAQWTEQSSSTVPPMSLICSWVMWEIDGVRWAPTISESDAIMANQIIVIFGEEGSETQVKNVQRTEGAPRFVRIKEDNLTKH